MDIFFLRGTFQSLTWSMPAVIGIYASQTPPSTYTTAHKSQEGLVHHQRRGRQDEQNQHRCADWWHTQTSQLSLLFRQANSLWYCNTESEDSFCTTSRGAHKFGLFTASLRATEEPFLGAHYSFLAGTLWKHPNTDTLMPLDCHLLAIVRRLLARTPPHASRASL